MRSNAQATMASISPSFRERIAPYSRIPLTLSAPLRVAFLAFLRLLDARSCTVLVLIVKRVHPDAFRLTERGRPPETKAPITQIW